MRINARRTHLWAWGGAYFGYLEDDDLWDCDGTHVGKLRGDAFYAPNGDYLCTIVDNRLRVDVAHKGSKADGFDCYDPRPEHTSQERRTRYIPRAGYEDCSVPAPSTLQNQG